MTYNLEYAQDTKIRIDGNGFFICPFCHEPFRALVYHTRQVHNIDARKIRELFNLPYNYPLQVEEIRIKRSKDALRYNMDKQLIKTGAQTRFKKGRKLEPALIKKIKRGHMIKTRMVE